MMLATTECFFFNDTATTEIYTLSLHDALPISGSDIKVFELMAPLVDTPFAKDVNSDAKVPPAEVADALLTNLEQDVLGMHVGITADMYQTYLKSPEQALRELNAVTGG